MIKIYLITNDINSKKYVGQTIKSLEIRFKRHCWDSEVKKKMPITLAIKKYGKEHFQIKEIDSATTLEEANKKEVYWAKKYNCFSPHGYNLKAGGRKYLYMREETKEKIRKANTGRKASEETKKRLSESHKGYKVKQSTKDKLSQRFSGQKPNEKSIMGAKTKCCKRYLIESPNNEIIEVVDLKSFCKKMKLVYTTIVTCFKQFKTYRGWRLIKDLGYMYQILGSRRNPLKS